MVVAVRQAGDTALTRVCAQDKEIAVSSEPPDSGDFIFYATDDGEARLQVRMSGETVWLSIDQMAELFQRSKSVISRHVSNVFAEGELDENRTVAKYATVQMEGSREVQRTISYYNLDVIISVGYRVKSLRGTQFRIWATNQLRDYIVKGFVLNDDRFKNSADNDYFEELLGRIRDIRASEKVFYKKVLDLFATSVDYDKSAPQTQRIFALIQNKLHWAAHGHTAAEVVHDRADAAKPNMGLTSWSGQRVRKRDIEIAKNYLSSEELDTLNRLVNAYLDIAELQARSRKPFHMQDWEGKLNDLLMLAGHEILQHQGRISRAQANEKAALEYELFHREQINATSQVEKDFEEATREIEQMKIRKRSLPQ